MLVAVSVIKSLAVLIGALKIMNRQDHGTDSYRIERYSHINIKHIKKSENPFFCEIS